MRIVIVSLRRGMTTRAVFQNALSVGRISGSSTTAAWTSSSVMPRSRFQSVATLALEVLPVVSTLMRLRSPCGNDVTLVLIPVGIDDRDLDAVHEPNGIDANPRRTRSSHRSDPR